MLISSTSSCFRPQRGNTSSWHAQPHVHQLRPAVARHSRTGAAATSRQSIPARHASAVNKPNLGGGSSGSADTTFTSTLEWGFLDTSPDELRSRLASVHSNAHASVNRQNPRRDLLETEKQLLLLRMTRDQQAAGMNSSSSSSSNGNMAQQALSRVYVSGSTDIGPKKKSMEDRHTIAALCAVNGPLDNWQGCIELDAATAFAAIYDGHGGHMTATHAAHQLHHHLHRKLHHNSNHNRHHYHHLHRSSSSSSSSSSGPCRPARQSKQNTSTPADWAAALQCTFCEFDEHWKAETMGMQFDQSGSTAVVALVNQHSLIVANAGDSVAVVARAGAAVCLSQSHKADAADAAESARVAAAGGVLCKGKSGLRLLQNPGSLPAGERYVKQPHLAVTRGLGDFKLKRHGHPIVSAEPHVCEMQLAAEDALLLLASDGVTDVLTHQQMIETALEAVHKARSSAESGDVLAQVASQAVTAKALEGGAWDNLTVVAMLLHLDAH